MFVCLKRHLLMSKSKTIILRADGNSKTGLGHLYRMFAISEFLKNDYKLIFITSELTTLNIIPNDYTIKLIPKEIIISEEPKWLGTNFLSADYIIIADGYQFKTDYQKNIKSEGFQLIYIDDLVNEHMYADIVVNHSPKTELNYQSENYTKFALGTKYALLRPKFNELAKKTRNISKVNSAFVCFGGADQYDLSLKATKALLKINTIGTINVVLGGAYSHQEIYKLKDQNSKVKLHKNLNEKDLCTLILNNQIAIAPASTILYELCSIKIPVLSGYFVQNQEVIYKELANKGVIYKGGDFSTYTIQDFENKITTILNDSNINTYLNNQQLLFDGKNKTRFLGLVNSLSLRFRKATIKDLMLTFNWSNDILVRQNSYNSESIVIASHTSWFLEKIKSKEALFLIALINNIPAGIVRFEIKELNAVVGILISKEYRGQKLASIFLIKAANYYFKIHKKPILAYIKKSNHTSVKAFKKAKYSFVKEKEINKIKSYIYKLEKKDVD